MQKYFLQILSPLVEKKAILIRKYSKTEKRLKEKFVNDEQKFRYLNWFQYFLLRIKFFVDMKAVPLLSKARL